jgi:hypothetical protein
MGTERSKFISSVARQIFTYEVMVTKSWSMMHPTYIVYEPVLPVLPGDENLSGAIRLAETGYKMYRRETGKLKRAGRVTHLSSRFLIHNSTLPPVSSTAIISRSITVWTWSTMARSILRLALAVV